MAITQTSHKPVAGPVSSLRAQSPGNSIIEQIAFLQKDLDRQEAGGITVPEIGAAAANDPANSVPDVPVLPDGTAGGTAALIESPAGVQGLTLDQAINTCLLADPTLRAGFEAINQANADALSASLKPNPNLGVSQTLLPLTRPFTVTRQGGPPQLDAGLAYPIDWFLFGKRAAAMSAANLGVNVSQAEYENLIRERVAGVSLAYFHLAEAIAVRKVVAESLDSLRKVEAAISRAVDQGGKARVELQRISLDRLAEEQVLRDADLNVAKAKSALRTYLGEDFAGQEFELSIDLEATYSEAPPVVDDAYSEALANRPDVNAQRWRVEQATAETNVQYRLAFPEVTPKIGYTRQFQEKAVGFPDANSWGIGVDLSLPFCNRNQGNRLRAESQLTQQQHELQVYLVELRAEVEQAIQELHTASANAEAVAKEQLQLASQIRDSINQAYLAGGLPLVDVIDAQRRFRETYRLFISSRANYRRAVVKFNAAVGKQVVP